MHLIHKWEDLGEQWIHRFDVVGDYSINKIACRVRKCRVCERYQYKHSVLGFWTNCEISGRNGNFELCELGFRVGRGLLGDISPEFNGTVRLTPVKKEN